ncbi:MAG: TonB-dependent siderophore receptor [Caulobacteraceae bacterium]
MTVGSGRRAALAGAAFSAIMWAAASGSAWAADDTARPSTSVSEVVVTGARNDTDASAGTKSDTPLVETPQSITVITRDELDLRGVDSLSEALHYTAGVSPEVRGDTAGRYDLLNIRGFAPDQYLDGLRLIQSTNGYAVPQIDITSLDRIEVVKGPASVLYGEASPGGLVALTSKLPTAQPFGEVQLSGGSYGYAQGAFDLGGPIDSDGKFLFRLDGMADRSDTQIRLSESQRYVINPALTWRPDDKTSWTLLYSYQHDPRGGDYGADPVQGSLLPNPNGRVPEDFYDGEPGFERFRRTQQAISSLFARDLGDGWTFHQNTRFMRITTSYESVYQLGLLPDDRTLSRSVAVANEGIDNLTLDNQVTGALHTGPLTHTIVAGVDFQHTGQTEAAGFGGVAAGLDAFDPVYGSPVTPPATSFSVRLNLEQTGVYGQDQIALDRFRLMLSGRYDWVDSRQFDRLGGGTAELAQGKFTGRAGLLYLFDNGLAPYVSYSTSFQPQTAESISGSVLPPTQGKQTEVGLKYQPHVWDTLVTLSLYDLRQTNVATADPADPSFSVAAGEVRSRGVELEGHTKPLPGVVVSGSYTYLDNMVTKDNTGLVGTRPYGVPQQTANLFGVYSFQSGWAQGAGLGGGVRFIGQSFNGVAGDGALKVPSATVFDLIATYDFSRLNPAWKGLSLNVNVQNLFGARYISACYSTIWCWYGAQRDAEATVRYRW